MIKKILMISENDIASKASLGVTKKILGQYKAFQNLGYDVYNLCLENGDGVLIHGKDKKTVVAKKIKSYFTVAKLYMGAADVCSEYGIDCCYIRYPLADWAFMKMIKKLHNLCKVVVEIPTYPYDDEVKKEKSIITKINYLQDKKNRNKLNKYVLAFVTYGDYSRVFNTKCISIHNGINIDSIEFIPPINNGNTIQLVGVALLVNAHGYDRIIRGLGNYYSHNPNPYKKVLFNIVGDGPEKENLEALVKENSVKDYVHFLGALYGNDLTKSYYGTDIGIAYFAGHRIGLKKTSALKMREYCARGIPFIGSMPDDAFPEDKCPFYKLFPANDDPIDIDKVIEFYDYIKAHPEIHRQMREYAEQNLSWEKQLKKVMDEVEK